MTEALSYCAVRSLCGKAIADEMFDRHLPHGLDMDVLSDQEIAAVLTREDDRCNRCPTKRNRA